MPLRRAPEGEADEMSGGAAYGSIRRGRRLEALRKNYARLKHTAKQLARAIHASHRCCVLPADCEVCTLLATPDVQALLKEEA